MLRFRHKMRPRKIKVFPTGGPEERLKKMRQIVTGLIRYERIEPTYAKADEARQYAERLIYLAIKNGDKHAPTMEIADYWLLEKDLIHKLFKVLVPRYKNFNSSYTSLHKMAVEYPGQGFPGGVLELKGNPWPPVTPKPRNTQFVLSNVLLSAAQQDFYAQKQNSSQMEPQTEESVSNSVSGSPQSSPSAYDLENDSVSSNSSSVDPPKLGSAS